jgi:hypothetical protein
MSNPVTDRDPIYQTKAFGHGGHAVRKEFTESASFSVLSAMGLCALCG